MKIAAVDMLGKTAIQIMNFLPFMVSCLCMSVRCLFVIPIMTVYEVISKDEKGDVYLNLGV